MYFGGVVFGCLACFFCVGYLCESSGELFSVVYCLFVVSCDFDGWIWFVFV